MLIPPYASRSLPPGSDARPYYIYEVIKPIDVQAGEIAPWFGQPGEGIQYQFTQSIDELIQSGYLRRLPWTCGNLLSQVLKENANYLA